MLLSLYESRSSSNLLSKSPSRMVGSDRAQFWNTTLIRHRARTFMRRGQLCDADSYAMRTAMRCGHTWDSWDASRWDEEQSWEGNRWRRDSRNMLPPHGAECLTPPIYMTELLTRYGWKVLIILLLLILLSSSEEKTLKKEKSEKIHWEGKTENLIQQL